MQFAASPVVAEDLAADIDQFRADLENGRAGTIVGDAKRLHTTLLGPVRRWIGGTGLLVYSPSLSLRGVPFAALHDGRQFLIESRPVIITRAMSSLIGRSPSAAARTRSALVALPSPADGSAYLNGATKEASAVASLYGTKATSLLGADATLGTFTEIAPRFDVIHVGTHGTSNSRPLQNAMEFGSRRLRAYDVLSWRLSRSPLVVLAGCRTDDETEGNTMLSLASAFVAAGASAVVGSLWDVEDSSTAQLMTDFHRELSRGAAPANALMLAQRAAIARHADVPSWAAFQLQM